MEFFQCHAENRVCGNAGKQIVFPALLLDHPGSLHGVHPDPLVELLAVAAPLHSVHHDVLGGHKGQLPEHMLMDHLGVHHQAVSHVVVQVQNAVHCQERLGHADALVGGVIQGALEPLGSHGHGGVQGVSNDIPGQRGNALAAHGVALIGHGGRADLVLLKGFLHLFQVLQQADIVGELGSALSNAGEDVQHLAVQLPGIGLAGNGKASLVPHLLGDLPVQFPALFVVALKQL